MSLIPQKRGGGTQSRTSHRILSEMFAHFLRTAISERVLRTLDSGDSSGDSVETHDSHPGRNLLLSDFLVLGSEYKVTLYYQQLICFMTTSMSLDRHVVFAVCVDRNVA